MHIRSRMRARRALSSAFLASAILAACLFLLAPEAPAAVVPTGFIDQLVVGNLSQPCGIAFLPDGRILVAEQTTRNVRVIARRTTGDVASGAILTIPEVSTGGEQGLLGIAVDPGWPARPYVYVHFTANDAHVWIRMYRASGTLTDATSLNLSLSNPYTILNDCPHESPVHNGGTLRFGPDGRLYVSLGDDLSMCDAQTLDTMHGVILRLNVASLPQPGSGPPARSLITPPDNPFVTDSDLDARLVAFYGLRNPFRFGIDPNTGRLYIGDVGESDWEELDETTSLGMNFGWPRREGAHPYPDGDGCPGSSGTNPIYEWDRFGYSASIIGGPRYRSLGGSQPYLFPASYNGDVFLADYYVGWLRRLKFSGTSWALAPAVSGQPSPVNWAQDLEYVSDVIQGRDGGLYYVKQFSAGFGPGQIRRIIYSVATDVGSADPLPGDALRVTPNPGRAAAVREITFTLSRTAHAVLGVYSATGARLATVFDRVMDAGAHHVSWDGHDDRGSRVAPGVYLVRLELDGATTVTRKVAVLQ